MRAAFLALLLSVSGAALAQSELQIEASATPIAGLAIGTEIRVDLMVRNLGPATCADPFVEILSPHTDEFEFDLVATVTPDCTIDSLELSPPRFNLIWAPPSLPAGGAAQCTFTLRARRVPASNSARLDLTLTPLPGDPVPSNNSASLQFSYGATRRQTIPALSAATLVLLVAVIALLTACTGRGRVVVVLLTVGVSARPLPAGAAVQLFSQVYDASPATPPRAQSVYPVDVDFSALLESTQVLRIDLPGTGVVDAQQVSARFVDGRLDWAGKAGSMDIVLSVRGPLVTGFFRGGAETYSLLTLGTAEAPFYALQRMDEPAFPLDELVVPGAAKGPKGPRQDACIGTTNQPIDLLVVYSPEALAAAGGDADVLANQVDNAVLGANVTLANSAVPAEIRLVRFAAAPASLIEDGSTKDYLRASSNPELQAMRREAFADIVTYLTSDATTFCGVTSRMRNGAAPWSGYRYAPAAYNVVTWQCGIQNNDLSHEIAHNAGLGHNPAFAPGEVESYIFPYAFGHAVDGVFRDDMAGTSENECPNGCPRQMFFSDPQQQFDGHARGVAEARDGARTYRQTFRCLNTFAEFLFGDGYE